MSMNGTPFIPGALASQGGVQQQINVIPTSDVHNLLVRASSTMATCQAQLLDQIATLSQLPAVIEHAQKALSSVSLIGQGIDRSVFAGEAEVERIVAAVGALADIVQRLGAAVASETFTGMLPKEGTPRP